jgi:S1-C subfamily serine protease
VTNNADLYLALEKHKDGDRVKARVLRDGATLDLELALTLNVNQ